MPHEGIHLVDEQRMGCVKHILSMSDLESFSDELLAVVYFDILTFSK